MNTKQVIVIRKDLKMRRGKEVAQGCHSSMAFLTKRLGISEMWEHGTVFEIAVTAVEREWLDNSFRKVTLQVDSEDELMKVYEAAQTAGLTVHLVEDAGLTEFDHIKTKTCLAIGPDYDYKIDPITKHLKLY